jgi:hypothetical protein
MRRFRPAPLSRLALLECDQKSDRLFTDLGLRDDLQAAVARKRQLREFPGSRFSTPPAKVLTDGMRAMFVERSAFVAKPIPTINSVPRLTTCLMPGERKKASTRRGDAMLEGEADEKKCRSGVTWRSIGSVVGDVSAALDSQHV